MRRPSRLPRRHRTTTDPTWQGIIATTAVVLAVPALLWAAANPLVAGLALSAGVGVVRGGRRALRLRRCLADCGGFAVALAGNVRVCVTRQDAETAC